MQEFNFLCDEKAWIGIRVDPYRTDFAVRIKTLYGSGPGSNPDPGL